MKRCIKLSAIIAVVLSALSAYLLLKSGGALTNEVAVKLQSLPPVDGARQTFYIIALCDAEGKRLITAEQLTREATCLKAGRLVNDGHGIWADLPANGKTFCLEWKGRIPLPRHSMLYAEAGKSRPGSVLKITLGEFKSSVDINTLEGISTVSIPLGLIGYTGRNSIFGFSLMAVAAVLLLCVLLWIIKDSFGGSDRRVRSASAAKTRTAPDKALPLRDKLIVVLKKALSCLWLSGCCFVLLPLVVYVSNLSDVAFSRSLLWLYGGTSVCMSALLLGLSSYLPRVGRRIWHVLLFCGCVLVFMIAFPVHSQEMTGIDSLPAISRLSLLGVGRAFLFTVGLAVCAIFRRDFYHVILLAAIVTSGVMLLYCLMSKPSDFDRESNRDLGDDAYFTQLGAQSNIVVIVLDGYTGYRFHEVLQEHPMLVDAFEGFTYFPRAIANAISTPSGISALLTGSLETAINVEDIRVRMQKSVALSHLKDAASLGYDVAYIRNLTYDAQTEVPSLSEQAFGAVRISRTPDVFLSFWKDSLRRVLPERAASLVGRLVSSALKPVLMHTVAPTSSHPGSTATADERKTINSVQTFLKVVHGLKCQGPRKYIFFHSKVSHPPWCFTSEGAFKSDAGDREASVYSVRLTKLFLDRLRELPGFDSSLVIVTADHGWLSLEDESMGEVFRAGEHLHVFFNPLVLVKKPYSTGPIVTDTMSVWLGDVSATIRDYLGCAQPEATSSISRSLIADSDPQRSLQVPLFFKTDEVSVYKALKDWARVNVSGTFNQYGVASVNNATFILENESGMIRLFAGIDTQELRELRWKNVQPEKPPLRAIITLNRRTLAKIGEPGLVVIRSPDSKGHYSVERYAITKTDGIWQEVRPPADALLICGVAVSKEFVQRWTGDTVGTQEDVVNFVWQRTGDMAEYLVGTNDVELTSKWVGIVAHD